MELFDNPDVMRLLFKSLDVPLILAVCVFTQQVKHLVSDRWRPLVPLVLGAVAALGVQPVSPFPATPWNLWRRMLTYGAGACVAFSLRKAWMPPALAEERHDG